MLEVKGLTVSYSNKIILNNINFQVEDGNIVGLIGPNGVGKSTLIKAILNLVDRDSGEVYYENKKLDKNLKKVAYLPQRSEIDFNFPLSVLDVVLMGLYPSHGLVKKFSAKDIELAEKTLKRVGMEDYARRQIGRLSGGQQQRVFMARVLIQQPEVIFLDEPLAGIDAATETVIMKILHELRDEGKLIIVVHHNLTQASELFDQVIILKTDGYIIGKVNEVFNLDNLADAYKVDFKVLGR